MSCDLCLLAATESSRPLLPCRQFRTSLRPIARVPTAARGVPADAWQHRALPQLLDERCYQRPRHTGSGVFVLSAYGGIQGQKPAPGNDSAMSCMLRIRLTSNQRYRH